MTHVLTVKKVCDAPECTAEFFIEGTHTVAVEYAARVEGWFCGYLPAGPDVLTVSPWRDFCPKHFEMGKRTGRATP